MLNLADNEKVLMVIRRHWYVMAGTIFLFVVLLLVPTLILTFLPTLTQNLDMAVAGPVINFGLSLYSMALLLFLFLMWMEYYLDVWIITNERIIDIQQKSLFNRIISEIPIEHVEDISVEIKGVVETFLKFGTLKIQTAGRGEFTIDNAPNLYEAKDLILQYAHGSGSKNVPQTPTASPH